MSCPPYAAALRSAGASTPNDALITPFLLPPSQSKQPSFKPPPNLSHRWFGTGQKRLVDGEWLSDSIHLYTSRDLASWRHKGRVFAAASIPDLTVPPPYR